MSIRKLQVKKHSAVIQMSNKITAQQRKSYNALLFIARNTLKQQVDTRVFHVDISLIKNLCGIKATNNDQLKNSIKDLMNIVVEYNILNKDKSKTWGSFVLLSQAEITNGRLSYEFPSRIHDVLLRPNIYTLLDLSIIKGLTSKYSIALYEILKDYQSIKNMKMNIDDFRELMDVEGTYKNFNMLRKRVIDQAVSEVNEKTDLRISYTLESEGRKVTHIEFHIETVEMNDVYNGNDNDDESDFNENDYLDDKFDDDNCDTDNSNETNETVDE